MMTLSENDFDKIGILSSENKPYDECILSHIPYSEEKGVDLFYHKEIERKRIARAVALVSRILFFISVVLVTVSLFMAKDIDEIGR
jgi:hypothetical protein